MDLSADYLIVGSGIAALRAAAELREAGDVIILTKGDASEGNTGYAQGGVAAAVADDDSPALHAADTIEAGSGLCRLEAVRALTEEGPRFVRELIAWGARFDIDADGRLALAREGAHSVRRVLHAHDATGREIGRALAARVLDSPRLRVIEHAYAVDAVVEDGVCVGMRFVDAAGVYAVVRARASLLATGGAGRVFSETTNPAVATGDGPAIAYRAGARVADLEFVQFHPTALAVPGAPRFLLSEALRGEGARLINSAGDAFMTRYHPSGDLAPRDVVSRAILREEERSGPGVRLTLAHLDAGFVHARFPLIAGACSSVGLDLARDPVPVGPAAHYMMGGVETDLDGGTSLQGLFAAGEVACTGVHGANRLASNSLLEGLVFGGRAGAAMRALGQRRSQRGIPSPATMHGADSHARWTTDAQPSTLVADAPVDVDEVRRTMWINVGVFRTRATLEAAVRQLQHADAGRAAPSASTYTSRGPETASGPTTTAVESAIERECGRNILTTARLVAHAALRREESRGGHSRDDFPERDDVRWALHVADRLLERGV